MATKACCYFGCKKVHNSGRSTYYHFPIHSPSRCRKWIKHSNNPHLIHMYNSSSKLIEKYRICDDHFEPKDFMKPMKGFKKELIRNAVPKKYISNNEERQKQQRFLPDSDDEEFFYGSSTIPVKDKTVTYESVYLPESAEGDLKALLMAPTTSSYKPSQFTYRGKKFAHSSPALNTDSLPCPYHDPLDGQGSKVFNSKQTYAQAPQPTQAEDSNDPFIKEIAIQFKKLNNEMLKRSVQSEIMLLLYNAIRKEKQGWN